MSSPPQEGVPAEVSASEPSDLRPAQRSLLRSQPSPAAAPVPETSSSESSGTKARRTRKHVSCEGCRQRKVKCSREQTCTNCRLRNQPCVYVDAEPLPPDDSVSYEDQLVQARAEIDRLRGEVARLTAERARWGGPTSRSSTASSFDGAHLTLGPGSIMYPHAHQAQPAVPMAQYALDAPDQYALANHPFAHFARQQRERGTATITAYGAAPTTAEAEAHTPPAVGSGAAGGVNLYHPVAAPAPVLGLGGVHGNAGFGHFATPTPTTSSSSYAAAAAAAVYHHPAHLHAYTLAAPPLTPLVPSWAYASLPLPTALAVQRAYEPYTPAVGSDPYYRSLRRGHPHGAGGGAGAEGEDVENGADEYAAPPAAPAFGAGPQPQQQPHEAGWAAGGGAGAASCE
ncbi:hypothetical protein JCM3770_004632 [Rhodotorula araucariae]